MRTLFTALAMIIALVSAVPRASAHSFNVALVIALSEPSEAKHEEIRAGFLLATKERDSHPDETSDGHLGGLDVHLHMVNRADSSPADLEALLKRNTIDILVAIGRAESIKPIRRLAANSQAILTSPGHHPIPDFAQTVRDDPPPVLMAFLAAFEKEFGYRASPCAALGYNTARRIDAAVRPLGGVADKAALQRALSEHKPAFDC